ncbi:MAG: M28 family peptidase [Saprospiraceae bacterium]|nr:M28 family peptidase [Saprospiraceae bacterium]
MKKLLLATAFAASQLALLAQMSPENAVHKDYNPFLTCTAPGAPYAATITAEDMRSYLSVLASDEFEGRETGEEGQRKAADFIAAHFEKLGLPKIGNDGSYFQKIAFTAESWDNGQIELTINGESYRHLSDFVSFPSANSNRERFATEQVVFLGYGIDDPKYSDYKGVDVKDKTILIYMDEPVDNAGNSWLTGTPELSPWSTDWHKKLEVALQHGVATVLLIDADIKKTVGEARKTLLSSEMRMGEGGNPEGRYANNAFISSTLAKEIVGKKMKKFVKLRDGIKKSGKPAHLDFPCRLSMVQKKNKRQLLGANVLGYLEGSDPRLKDEVVVVSAHYDHLGKKGPAIYHGADDNGSGSSTVMDIAQAFVQAKKEGHGPRRSILFLLVSGEEKGLLGSEYYSEHPIFPLEKTVADVNVDMIGRTDQKHDGNPNYIYVIGSNRLSTELHDINEAANTEYAQLELDYTFNAKNDPNRFYYRSDHYNFAKKGIPSIFYFSGVHKDYHQPSDTVDKIMFDKMERIGRLIFYTTWELANREQRIRVNVKDE